VRSGVQDYCYLVQAPVAVGDMHAEEDVAEQDTVIGCFQDLASSCLSSSAREAEFHRIDHVW
jgi:hypothetical protein